MNNLLESPRAYKPMHLIFMIVFFLCSKSFAQKKVSIEQTNKFNSLNKNLEIFIDFTQELSIEQLQKYKFTPFKENIKLDNNQAYWAKLSLKNNSLDDEKFILYLGNINYAEVYTFTKDRLVKKEKAGSLVPASQKKINRNNSAQIEINLLKNQEKTYYFKIWNIDGQALDLDVKLYTQESWLRIFEERNLFQGLLQGFLWMIIIYQISTAVLLRQKSSFFIALYLLCYSFYSLSINAIFSEFILGEYPILAGFIWILAMPLMIIFYLIFIKNFLKTKKIYPKWDRLLKLILYVFSAVSFVLLSVQLSTFKLAWFELSIKLITALVFVFILIFTLKLFFERNKRNQIFIITTLTLAFFVILEVIQTISYNSNQIGFQLSSIGFVLQGILMTVAITQQKKKLEQRNKQTNEKQIQILEKRLKAQEEALQEKNKALQQKTKELLEQKDFIKRKNKEMSRAEEILTKSWETAKQKKIILKQLNNELQQKNEELLQQQEEILAQRDFIENKNKELEYYNKMMKSNEANLRNTIEKLQERENQIETQNKELQQRQEEILAQRDFIDNKDKELRRKAAEMSRAEEVLKKSWEGAKQKKVLLKELSQRAAEMSRAEEVLKKSWEGVRKKEMLVRKANEELQQQNEKLQQQQEEIAAQRDFIENKNKELEQNNKMMKINETNLRTVIEQLQEKEFQIETQNAELLQQQEEILTQRDSIDNKNNELELRNKKMKANESILKKIVEKLQTKEKHIVRQNEELLFQKNSINDKNKELKKNNEMLKASESMLRMTAEELIKGETKIRMQNEQLQQKQEEIASQRDLIAKRNQALEISQKAIQGSVNAAVTIQEAILPPEAKVKRLLGNYEILYLPKDKVSGDFYWLAQVADEIVLIVADCTGHGIPGAFMTMIAHNLLNKIVRLRKITNPAKILQTLHEEVQVVLNQKETGNNSGMDAIALTFNEERAKLVFAGAKNSLFYMKAGETEIEEIKGTRKSIGGIQNEDRLFENHTIPIVKGSFLYAGSDGYEDQNDFRRKKVGKQRLKRIIEENANHSLKKQKNLLMDFLQRHMEGTTQRDDIIFVMFEV